MCFLDLIVALVCISLFFPWVAMASLSRHWVGLLVTLFLGVLIYYAYTQCKLIEVIGELIVAAVIYYEVEEGRAARFLEGLYDEAYKGRGEIYKAFAVIELPQQQNGPEPSPEQLFDNRVKVFLGKLDENEDLRKACDLQLGLLATANYSLQRSILPWNKSLIVRTFPQVLVKLWLIFGRYAQQREQLPAGYEGLIPVVQESIEYLESLGTVLQDIHGGPIPVQIPPTVWQRDLRNQLEKAINESRGRRRAARIRRRRGARG